MQYVILLKVRCQENKKTVCYLLHWQLLWPLIQTFIILNRSMEVVTSHVEAADTDDEHIQRILSEKFSIQGFRRGQAEILGAVLGGHDTLAVMPTGGGKSLCYQLPALCKKGIVLVVSPLISLMRDQFVALQERGIQAGCLHADQPYDEKRDVFKRMRESDSFLLYLSPERVQKPGFLNWLEDAPLSLIAVDEAHCISQWGADFRQDYYRLRTLRDRRPDVPIVALTATATPHVLNDISEQLHLQNPQRHVYGFYRPNLYYQVEFCENDDEKLSMLYQALTDTPEGRIIIYCGTRKRCEELCAVLSREFDKIDYYHAGLSGDARKAVQQRYEEGKVRVLAATNAFGMGIDNHDVRLVVHYQMPANIETYYQEMGRAGRDGEHSTCLLLYSRKDKGLQSYFIRESDAPAEIIQHRWQSLDAIVQYCEGGECRHAGILTYFRDTQRMQNCGHCDVCDYKSSRRVSFPQAIPAHLYNNQKKKRKGKGKAIAAPKKDPSKKRLTGPMSDVEKIRYDIVKEWRQSYAKERDMPAFLVFSNKTLEDLVRKDPETLAQLEGVYGLGQRKVSVFGTELLGVLEKCRG